MKVDYHLHSDVSPDSSTGMEGIVKSALVNNYEEIVFTDHLELNPLDIKNIGLSNFKKYFKEISKVKEEYGDRIRIRSGVEIGEYHRFYNKVDPFLEKYDLDVKISSVHRTSDDKLLSKKHDQRLSHGVVEDYYRENLEMVRRGGFDILGHLGIYERGYSDEVSKEPYLDLIKDIFLEMIDKGIALEVNYSGLRKGLGSVVPTERVIREYRGLGGDLITIGSDAHSLEGFDKGYGRAVDLLRSIGFDYVSVKSGGSWERFGI